MRLRTIELDKVRVVKPGGKGVGHIYLPKELMDKRVVAVIVKE